MAYTQLGDPDQVLVHDRRSGTTETLRSLLSGAAVVTYSSQPSLCADGTRLLFLGGTGFPESREHRSPASVFLVDVTNGHVIRRSEPGKLGGVESEHGRTAVVSPDCRRFAYVAPGEHRGKDLHGGDIFETDALLVVDVDGSAKPRRVKTSASPRHFVEGDPSRLVLSDGATVVLG